MRNSYSKETKAAVIAALLGGQSISKVAKDYDIPSGTINSWNTRHNKEENLTNATNASQKKEISDLIIELLETHLRAAIGIANAIDPSYIKKQSASEVAVLLGVINDKAFRMLEALGRAEDNDQSTES